MRNVKVVVEYDGTDYFGFQCQPNVPTIQGELEKVLGQIVKEKVKIYGSGRTDAGVHASGQVFNFYTQGSIPVGRICVAMNALLNTSISAIKAEEVYSEFHSRYSAKSRKYIYDILNVETKSALRGRYSWHVRRPLDVEAMKDGLSYLLGIHDFSSFACADREDDCSVRNMINADIQRFDEHVIVTLRANAFLRSMVRVIVGTLVEIGLGKRQSSEILEILEAADRRKAGKTAPPQGLCLVEVEY